MLFGWNRFCSYSVRLHFQLSDLNDCFLSGNTVNCLCSEGEAGSVRAGLGWAGRGPQCLAGLALCHLLTWGSARVMGGLVRVWFQKFLRVPRTSAPTSLVCVWVCSCCCRFARSEGPASVKVSAAARRQARSRVRAGPGIYTQNPDTSFFDFVFLCFFSNFRNVHLLKKNKTKHKNCINI